MPRGYDRALYILPFDHRGSFQTKMFGWKSPLGEAQTTEISGSESQRRCRALSALPSVALFSGIRWSRGGAKKRHASKQLPRSPSAIASSSICLSEQIQVCLLNTQIAPTLDITLQRRPDTCS